MIRLPRHSAEFPRQAAPQVPANAWGSQWKQLRRPVSFVRNAMHDGLRTLQG